ncbi:hypothetical protein HK104_005398, partial [Borealophlyctis nickersoniae]
MHSLGSRIHSYALTYPITTFQILVGSTLHVTHLLNITPYRSLLFHPRLCLPPTLQLWRPLTSVLVLGTSIPEVAQRAVGMTYWQAPLEKWFDGEGDVVRDGIVVREGENRRKADGSRKNWFEWLILDNAFLRAQLLAAVVVVSMEFVLYRDPTPAAVAAPLLSSGAIGSVLSSSSSAASQLMQAPGALLLFPYTLFPTLEYSLRWMWAITDQEREIVLFGVLPVKPVYLPLALCAMGGFGAWKSMLKGAVAAIVVGKVMDMRRAGGENAVDWLF